MAYGLCSMLSVYAYAIHPIVYGTYVVYVCYSVYVYVC
jgi:hypothetical protein